MTLTWVTDLSAGAIHSSEFSHGGDFGEGREKGKKKFLDVLCLRYLGDVLLRRLDGIWMQSSELRAAEGRGAAQ